MAETVVPTFGLPDLTLPKRVRPSAYGLFLNKDDELLLVRTARGCYLPGGGAAAGESIDATIEREVAEEIGLRVSLGTWRREAIEHAPAPSEGASFEKRSTFRDGVIIGRTERMAEADHVELWVAPAAAISMLRPASHRWAVTEWLSSSFTARRGSRPW